MAAVVAGNDVGEEGAHGVDDVAVVRLYSWSW